MTPRATYRLQLHAGFPFAAAAAAVPYLAELGVSHLYLSPVLQAAAGSTHGYDVVDPDRVSAELGGEAGFRELVRVAKAAGLAILLDIVPNHMSIAGTGNRWWLDVLENGAASTYAHYFDVDWDGDDRVLLPVLGERYGRALTSRQIALGRWDVRVHDLRLPMSPRSVGVIAKRAGERIGHRELQFIGDALCELRSPAERDREGRRRRHRDKAVLGARLGELAGEPGCGRALDDELAAIAADPVELDAILELQRYRLAHWSVAGSELTYRRFFDIATLVGVRNEDADVLEAAHRRIFEWLADGAIDGVRVDHVDGLREPGGYLRALRDRAPEAWIVVEKILAPGEQLPGWPIDGTTGYDFCERMDQLFADPAAERALTDAFRAYTGEAFDPAAESRRARLEVMTDALHAELARLTQLAMRACATSPTCRDYTRAEIAAALAEILAGYETYRTYLGEPAHGPEDRPRIARACQAALAARPELDRDLVAFLEAALAFALTSPESLELARVAQQTSGPIVAKGDEDTLLYRQVRLLSRCEVGCDPRTFAGDPAALHAELASGRPRSLLATATHDTKRGEDVRARIAAISEVPAEWAVAVARWRSRTTWGDVAPDRTLEYALWQTLVGAWPLERERAQQWAEKASREARLRTSWRRPDAAYDAARVRWIDAIYDDRELVADVALFAERLRPHGDRNALAQTLIKLTAPGVPDIYRGSEGWDGSLVDPDNRRPVDLAAFHAALRALEGARAEDVRGDLARAKPWLIRRVLHLRRREPARWTGPYRALAAAGPHAHRVFAFARSFPAGADGDALVTAVPRLAAAADGWRGTTLALPPGRWRNLLDDTTHTGTVTVADLWRAFPVALLVR
jgi:(1->4)-alpha-D-glucan 1-alpha-D-glucosylmutase